MKTIFAILFLFISLSHSQTSKPFTQFIDEINATLEKPYKINTKFVSREETVFDKIAVLFTEKKDFLESEATESTLRKVMYADSPIEQLKTNSDEFKTILKELKDVLDKTDLVLSKQKPNGVSMDYYGQLRTGLLQVMRIRVYQSILDKNNAALKKSLTSYFNFLKYYQAESNNLLSSVVLTMHSSNTIKEIAAYTGTTASQKSIVSQVTKSTLGPIIARDEYEDFRTDLLNAYLSLNYTYWMDFNKIPNPTFKDVLSSIASEETDPDLKSIETLPKYFKKYPVNGSFANVLVPILLNEKLPPLKMNSNPAIRDFIMTMKTAEFIDGAEFNYEILTLRQKILQNMWIELGQNENMDLEKIQVYVNKLLSDDELRNSAKDALLKSSYLYHYFFFMLLDKFELDFSFATNKIIVKKYLLEKRLKKLK